MIYWPCAKTKDGEDLFTSHGCFSIPEALRCFDAWNVNFHMTEMWIDVFTDNNNGAPADVLIVKHGRLESKMLNEMPQEIYYKLSDGKLLKMLWSDNEPADPDTATGVIGIYIYDANGNEVDGGELDVQDEAFDLRKSDYVLNVIDFMDLNDVSFESITKEQFDSVIKN